MLCNKRFCLFLRCFNTSYNSRTYSVEHKNKNKFYDPHFETSIHGATPSGKVGGRHLVTMAPGEGTGPEQMEILKEVFYCSNAPIMFEELNLNDDTMEADIDNMVLSIKRNGVAVKGNIEKDIGPQTKPKNLELNQRLDLFANMVSFKSFPGVKHRNALGQKLDITLVRQNIEGEYSMLEHDVGRAIQHLKVTTRFNTVRLARFAFKHALDNNMARVVTLHNKDFHEVSEALFVNCCKEVAAEHPSVAFKVQSVNSFLHTVWSDMFRKNVLIVNGLAGKMISNMMCGYIGSSGLVSSCNFGDRYAVFEPAARQRGYKLVGKNKCNPTAIITTGVNLLRHLKQNHLADIIERAVLQTVNKDLVLTRDIGGTATTREMADNILKLIKADIKTEHCTEVTH